MSDEEKKIASASTGNRKGVRYKPDTGTFALIDTNPEHDQSSFDPSIHSLVLEESYRGCGLVLAMTDQIEQGRTCLVQVGNGPVLRAEVRWRKELDSLVIRAGIMYLE